MTALVLGLILFLLPHMLREFGLRAALADRFPSPGAYKGAFSLVALLGLALVVWGKSIAPFIMIWEPPFGLRDFSHFLMMPVFFLLLTGMTPKSWLRAKLRNPMLLGVTLWGAAHLWANGDLASMLLFGGFTLWGAVKYASLWRTTELPPGESRQLTRDILNGGAGSILYWLVFIYHGHLFGVGLVL